MSRPCRSCFSPVRHPHRGPWRQSATSMPTLWAPSRGFATFCWLRCWQCQEAVFPLRIVRPRRPGLPALWVSHLCYASRLMLADEPVCSPFNQSHPRVSWLVRCGDDRRSRFLPREAPQASPRDAGKLVDSPEKAGSTRRWILCRRRQCVWSNSLPGTGSGVGRTSYPSKTFARKRDSSHGGMIGGMI